MFRQDMNDKMKPIGNSILSTAKLELGWRPRRDARGLESELSFQVRRMEQPQAEQEDGRRGVCVGQSIVGLSGQAESTIPEI